MRALNLVSLILLIVGGLNWGLYAIDPRYDVVAAIGGGPEGAFAKLVYALVGLSAIWQIIALATAYSRAPRGVRAALPV